MPNRTIHFSEIHTGRVEAGEKRCTIRSPRKLSVAAGDTLKLRGPRFAGRGKIHPQPARLLRTATCVGVNEIVLHFAPDHSVRAIDISGPAFDAPTCVASSPAWAEPYNHFSEIHTGRVEAAEKRCTIRRPRKRPVAAGDTLKLRGPRFAGQEE